jgi:segregation and condensation protein B
MTPPRLHVVGQDKPQDERASADSPQSAADAAASPVHDLIANISGLPAALDRRMNLRVLEAVLFAAAEPLSMDRLQSYLPKGEDMAALLAELKENYQGCGVRLVEVAGKWMFRTAGDLSHVLERHAVEQRRLSRAALETLAIVAYHQPVTRAEIEEIRGVTTSKGSLDVLMEAGWVRPRGRRRAPGKPLTYGTTDAFLSHFGLAGIKDLPGLAELKGTGLLDANLPPGFKVPEPNDVAALMPDELPIEAGDDESDENAPELDLDPPDEDEDEADSDSPRD